MIIPQMYSSIISLSNTLPSKTKDLYNNYIEKLNKNPQLLEVVEGIYEKASEAFSNWVRNTLLPQLTEVIGGVGSGVKTLMISIKDIVMGLVVAIYVLNARVTINSKANRFLYGFLNRHRAGLIKKEVYYANSMFSGFMGGKLLDSAIIGLICYIFCLISKMPNTLLVSAIIGLTNVVPVFGPFIGAIPTSLLILIEDPVKCLIFVIFIIILQQFDGNLIGPAILGKGTGLSSFEVLVSILVFGGLFGFIGMIIGVPLYATLSHITRQIILFGLKKHGQGDCIQAKQIVKELEEMENGANLPLNKDWENL